MDQTAVCGQGDSLSGKSIPVSEYLDTEDFAGALPKVFDDALAFVMRNLHKVQAGRGVNALGCRRFRKAYLRNCWSMPWCIGTIW